MKETINDFIHENFGTIVTVGSIAILVFGGLTATSIIDRKNDEKFFEVANSVSEKMQEKMVQDIREASTIELSDDFYIDLTHVNLNDGTGFIADSEKYLDLQGISNDNQVYKLKYGLTDKQVNLLQTNIKKATVAKKERAAIETLGEVFELLELSNMQVSDLNAISLGLEDSKDFKKLGRALGMAADKHNFFSNANQYRTPDYFLPTFSKVEVVERNGEKLAKMTLEGLELHQRSKTNIGAGLAFGSLASSAFDSPGLGMLYGVTMAYATAYDKTDTYSRTDEIYIKLEDGQETLDEVELRNLVVNTLMSSKGKYVKNTIQRSDNLKRHRNKVYASMFKESKYR